MTVSVEALGSDLSGVGMVLRQRAGRSGCSLTQRRFGPRVGCVGKRLLDHLQAVDMRVHSSRMIGRLSEGRGGFAGQELRVMWIGRHPLRRQKVAGRGPGQFDLAESGEELGSSRVTHPAFVTCQPSVRHLADHALNVIR